MLEKYFFDLPFYARLDNPVTVIAHWDDPDLRQHDSQRKELADAGQFDQAAAAKLLVLPAALPALLCRSATSWVLGPSSAVTRYPFLGLATDVHQESGTTLWRIDTTKPAMLSALACR
ncbi:MAG: hypothetical protein IPJ36_06765 [Simplicispira sp.]|nr:hypothetical protein [Simplicispira sp.]